MLFCLALTAALQGETGIGHYESGCNVSDLRQLDSELNESLSSPEKMKKVETGLIQVLNSDATFESKRFACSRLAVCGTEASVDALATLLCNGNTVGIACLALGSISSEKAGNALRNAALKGQKGPALIQIISTLGNRAEPASIPVLIKLAVSEDIHTSVAAVHALGAVNDIGAQDALTELRRKGIPAVMAAAEDASLQMAQNLVKSRRLKYAASICGDLLQVSKSTHIRRGAFTLLLQCQSDGGADLIAGVLENKPVDPVLAAVAINHVPELEGWFVSRRFSKLLDNLPPEQKVLLIHALACRNEPSTRKAVRKQLNAEDDLVKRAALTAMGHTGDEDAVPVLVTAFSRNSSAEDALALENALTALKGDEKTDQALCCALQTTDALTLKKALIGALSRRGGQIAAHELVNAACGSDEDISKAALQALTLLAGTGNTASLNAIQAVLAKGDIPHRRIALKTLSAWRGTATWDTLAEIYLNSQQEAEYALAWRGLIRMLDGCNAAPDETLFTRYREVLDGAHSDADRKQALGVLAGVRHPGALDLIYPWLNKPTLKDDATAAIKRIADAIQQSHPDVAKTALDKIKR